MSHSPDVSMGGVASLPALVGNLANRLLYYLLGANYNQQSISTVSDKEMLVRWRGRDFHVYDRMGYVLSSYQTLTIISLFFLNTLFR